MFSKCHMLRFVQIMLYAILKYWVTNWCELHGCEPVTVNENATCLQFLFHQLLHVHKDI